MRLSRHNLLALAAAALLAPAAVAVDDPPAEAPVEVDIVRLTSIEWKPGEALPRWIADLDGREVIISGYMFGDVDDEVSTFSVVSDSCTCSGSPLPHHFVEVTLTEGTTRFKPGEQTFRGTFSASPEEEDGFVTSLYRLEGDFF